MAGTEEVLRLLVASVRDYAIFMLDPGGYVASWNAGAERIKGYTTGDIVGRHFSAFYPPEDAGKPERLLDIAQREGRAEDEGWRVRKDGSRFWANVVITAVRGSDGALIGYAKVTRDLTERHHAEQRLREAEERYRRLIDSVRDYAIFVLDANGRVVTWNAGAERIKGYRAEEIIGEHFSRFYPEADVRAGKCEMELESAARDGAFEDEGWRVRKDGSQFWANVVISAIRDEAGALVGYSKVTRDLTDRKRSEDERAARLVAEEATRTKDHFLATLGHELRNPLAAVSAALDLIRMRGDASREHEVIERQLAHLTHLVDDLLDVARIAQGKIDLRREPIDLRHAVAKAAEAAASLFQAKQQQFEVASPEEPLVVRGDEVRLIQVFANLLTNASKFTPSGGRIVLTAGRAGDQLTVEVRDDGIGIAPELLPRVFDLFVQGSQPLARTEGGLGLGLTLVKQLALLHGGTVEAHSAGPGQGTSFIVRLPRDPMSPRAPTGPQVAPAPARAAARRILIVDDNDDARELLGELLGAMGHAVATAANGVEALAAIERFHPDVAVLDIGLPGMDGYALAEAIRSRPDGAALRLIALSGYGQPGDQERSERAGFDAHLVKPVDSRRLLERIRA